MSSQHSRPATSRICEYNWLVLRQYIFIQIFANEILLEEVSGPTADPKTKSNYMVHGHLWSITLGICEALTLFLLSSRDSVCPELSSLLFCKKILKSLPKYWKVNVNFESRIHACSLWQTRFLSWVLMDPHTWSAWMIHYRLSLKWFQWIQLGEVILSCKWLILCFLVCLVFRPFSMIQLLTRPASFSWSSSVPHNFIYRFQSTHIWTS